MTHRGSPVCKHCGRQRCAGICRRAHCPHCGRQRCYGCQSEAAQLVRQANALAKPPRPELAPAAACLLRYIVEYIDGTPTKERHTYGPTFGEIQLACTIPSPSTVSYHLQRLQLLGYIERDLGHRVVRSIRLTDKARAWYAGEGRSNG